MEKARSLIKEGEKLIDIRQKNIKVADRSEHGWVTVAEYEEDKLADNSNDEKRLFRVEQRAGWKLKQKGARDARNKVGAPRWPPKTSWPGPTSLGEIENAPQSSGSAPLVQNFVSQLQGHKRNMVTGAAATSPGTIPVLSVLLCHKGILKRKAMWHVFYCNPGMIRVLSVLLGQTDL